MSDMAMSAQSLYQNPVWSYLSDRNDQDILFEIHSRKYTAAWLKKNSHQLAQSLSDSGLKRGNTVVLALAPGAEFMLIFFACTLLRVRIALIDPHMGLAHYQAMVKQLNPAFAFLDSRLILLQEHPLLRKMYQSWHPRPVYFPKVKACVQVACGTKLPLFSAHLSLNTLLKKNKEPANLLPDLGDEDFLIVYTSGTLAEPKGVVHSFASLNHSIETLLRTFPDLKGKSIATHLPHFVLLGIRAGMQVHIWKEDWRSKKRYHYLSKNGIQVLFGPPSEWVPLLKHCTENNLHLPASLEHILLGSAPVYPSFIRALKENSESPLKITGIYGMTEHLLVSWADGDEIEAYEGDGTFVGKLFGDVQLRLGEDDEILIESPQLFKRYYTRQDRICPHPTGDRGSWNGENLCISGRKKTMIIKGNTNIYPELYEPSISSFPGVVDAALSSFYDESFADERIVLAVDLIQEVTDEQILKYLRSGSSKIHPDALPEFIVRMKIPRKGRQMKIDRLALQNEILCQLKL